MITGMQIRAARVMLRLTSQQLANLSGLHKTTIIRMESFDRAPIQGHIQNVLKLITAFESEGIEFIPNTSEKGLGLRFKQPV